MNLPHLIHSALLLVLDPCSAYDEFRTPLLKTESNWYLLRYKLIKRIHLQESEIKSKVRKNEHYFTYLLKICLSELEFNTLIDQNSLATASSFFRNQVVYEILGLDFLKILYQEIHQSLINTENRKYSF